MPICVDASFIVKLVVPESDSAAADALWRTWAQADERVLAPVLIDYEVASILRLNVFRRESEPGVCARQLEDYGVLEIDKEHDDPIIARAVEIANELGQPRAYDSAYIAVAERNDAELWTADKRLWNSAHSRFPFMRLLGAR